MRPDAVLTQLPVAKAPGSEGRPGKRGRPVPKPQQIAWDGRRPWKSCQAVLYGRKTTVEYKTFCAQWYCACGTGSYAFCWGMGGENQEFTDMDAVPLERLS